MTAIDSNSVGDPDRFRVLADLEEILSALPGGREDRGRVALLMRRGEGGLREVLDRVVLVPGRGFRAMPGDATPSGGATCRLPSCRRTWPN